MIRILTLTVDGRRYTSASYYDSPIKKFLNGAAVTGSPKAPPSIASQPATKVTK
jgi:hypothetical protein